MYMDLFRNPQILKGVCVCGGGGGGGEGGGGGINVRVKKLFLK